MCIKKLYGVSPETHHVQQSVLPLHTQPQAIRDPHICVTVLSPHFSLSQKQTASVRSLFQCDFARLHWHSDQFFHFRNVEKCLHVTIQMFIQFTDEGFHHLKKTRMVFFPFLSLFLTRKQKCVTVGRTTYTQLKPYHYLMNTSTYMNG